MNLWKPLTFVAAILLTGCSAVQGPKSVDWPWKDATIFCSKCDDQEAMLALARANQYCKDLQDYYENGGRGSNAAKFGMGIFGALSGSVFSTLAQGSAAKAWSGVSGAINATQATMEETFNAALSTKRRKAIGEVVEKQTTTFTTSKEAFMTAMKLAADCTAASSKTDAQMLQNALQ